MNVLRAEENSLFHNAYVFADSYDAVAGDAPFLERTEGFLVAFTVP